MFTLDGQFLHCKTGSWSCDSDDNADVFAAACRTANTKKGLQFFWAAAMQAHSNSALTQGHCFMSLNLSTHHQLSGKPQLQGHKRIKRCLTRSMALFRNVTNSCFIIGGPWTQ